MGVLIFSLRAFKDSYDFLYDFIFIAIIIQ